MCYFFLLPYSPDYNPIELGFSAIKAHVQQNLNPDANDQYVYTHLIQTTYHITSNDAQGFFNYCGYIDE
ncbi:hypothetical protein F5877DRAFT_55751 [Lentinula edodes]|nr:hypothetical protein F5877DRAFT_55751 [Lentinula edodes]